MRFVYQYLDPAEGPLLERPAERPTSQWRECARRVAPFLSEIFETYGLITVVKQGWALGAYREGGAIIHDSDGDVFIVMPSGCSLRDLRGFVGERVAEWNARSEVPRLTLNTIHPLFQHFVYRDFGHASLDARFADGTSFGIDIAFLSERSLFEDEGYNRDCEKRDGIRPDRLFRSLRICRFEGLRLCSFDDETMREYLALLYGPDFMTPRDENGEEVHLRNRRPLWRSGPTGYLFDIIDDYNIAFDIFECHRFPRFQRDA